MEAGLDLRDTLAIIGPAFRFSVVLLFRKPPRGSGVDCLVDRMTGGLNITGCRVTHAKDKAHGGKGRWPSNIAFIHDPACQVEDCSPGCPLKVLDRQSGTTKSSDDPYRFQGTVKFKNQHYVRSGDRAAAALTNDLATAYGDEGGASRFYPCFGTPEELWAWLERLVAPLSEVADDQLTT